MLKLNELTKKNWAACADLELPPDQQPLVASNAYSIAESRFEKHYVPRVISWNRTVVGFLMYCQEVHLPNPEIYWLFRFMLGPQYQSKGYGKKALRLAMFEMQAKGAEVVRTMHKPKNKAAAHLYASLGFEVVGTLADGDIELELALAKSTWLEKS